jgi:hypothetical protein
VLLEDLIGSQGLELGHLLDVAGAYKEVMLRAATGSAIVITNTRAFCTPKCSSTAGLMASP